MSVSLAAQRSLSSRQNQSDHSDFALCKTYNESGRRATPICLLFLPGEMQKGNSIGKHVYAVFMSGLVMFINYDSDTTALRNPHLVK